MITVDSGADSPAITPYNVTDVVTMGETMALMKAESSGPLAHVASLSLGMGGAESNFAIALRRLGTSVTWAGRVGADSLGEMVLRELAAEAINTLVSRDHTAPTGLMIKERRTAEAVKVWYYRKGSAGSRLCREDVPAEQIAQAKLLHITGITPALSTSAADAVNYALDCAQAAGTLVSFDLNYRSALWSSEEAGEQYRRIIPRADVVFAGDTEAAIAVGGAQDPWELARRINEMGASQAVIKLGADGCVAVVHGEKHAQRAVPIRAVDTVGAGDAFVAGYIAELLNDEDVPQRLLTAVRTGAFACLVPGDWEGMPRRTELDLLDSTEPVSR
ncbi:MULTISPECIES: sugar kinase [Paenarthrobacter]|uniref:sugar kinase n=1 Tax=Paenarthrobacter TaxID=1742992 RepID=UPI00074D2B9E|nr:sugar kinase [Paenarthrobacter ureafaciens]AMB42138.1 sugar kinase [Arthrobacter sp. ATCC 21022]RWW94829.1 sugar kinase [Paenarthrobacter ureafaciens]